MKKFLVAVMLAGFCLAGFAVEESVAPQTEQKTEQKAAPDSDRWDFLQIGFLPGAPTDMLKFPVYGIKIGAPICHGAPVYGVEASVLYSGSETVYGFQGSLIYSESENLAGLQLSIINFVKDCAGVQIGVFNSAETRSFQIGLLNHIKDGALPWCILFNCKF